MEYWQVRQIESDKRFSAALNKPLPPSEDMVGAEGYFDPWSDLFGDAIIGAYNSDIDQLAIDVLKAVHAGTTFDILDDQRRGLAAEMFMHMLAVDVCDYGTSPRGVFPATNLIKDRLPELIAKWEAWYEIKWGEVPDRAMRQCK